ncbi:unnamed protein product [Cunninghamella blakesleeana]
MDFDVEAMLEAPFMEKFGKTFDERHSPSRSHRSHSRHCSRHRSPSYDRHRSRSRSRREDRYREERRHRSRDYHRHRSRSPRRRSRSHDRYSSSRRHRSRSYSPPVPPEERDRRTVFVTQLAQRLRTRDFHDFFAQAGRVRDARIISDRNTRRSKGVGYVEFYDESSVQTALALSGQKLAGIPVMVQLTEAEKNRLALQAQNAENAAAAAAGTPTAPAAATPAAPGVPVTVPTAPIIYQRPHIPHIIPQAPPPPTHDIMEQRLYVGSVNYTLTDNDLRQVFEPYGPIDFVDLHRDNITGRSKGYAFIQFKNVKDAKEALAKMNGFELAGRNLKVGMVTERAPGAPNGFNTNAVDSGLDDDSNGISLNSTSRAELMKKLAARESGVLTSTSNVLPQQQQQQLHQPLHIVKPPVILPSRTVKLENMFNPAEETEPDWVKDLEVDIKEECQQYGAVEHINVDGDSLGDVYLKFNSIDAGQRAIQALNGRWFGGRQIRATFMTEAIYNTRFSL